MAFYWTGYFIALGIIAKDFEDRKDAWKVYVIALLSWFLVGVQMRLIEEAIKEK